MGVLANFQRGAFFWDTRYNISILLREVSTNKPSSLQCCTFIIDSSFELPDENRTERIRYSLVMFLPRSGARIMDRPSSPFSVPAIKYPSNKLSFEHNQWQPVFCPHQSIGNVLVAFWSNILNISTSNWIVSIVLTRFDRLENRNIWFGLAYQPIIDIRLD